MVYFKVFHKYCYVSFVWYMSVKRENNLTKPNLHTWRTATLSGNIFGKVEKIDRARERERFQYAK